QHKRHPEYFCWFDLPFWRLLLFASAQISDIVLADSENTRSDLLRFYRLPPRKVRVVPLGVDPVFFRLPRTGEARNPDPFLLAVSTLHPHKNLDRLLEAFAEFRRLQPQYRLVITGLRGFYTEALERLRDSLGLGGAVEFTGWIPREQLYELYARASAFLYPSMFEGFGLPVVEALAAGIPTGCSNIQPLAGIAGAAALQFNPHDTREIAGAMLRLTSDEPLRSRLSVEGPARAACFSWAVTARATLDALVAAA